MVCLQAHTLEAEATGEAAFSTDTVKNEDGGELDEGQAYIQESDEDLTDFVQDYIKKDTILKGAFFLEEAGSGKIFKLSLESVTKKTSNGPNNSKIVETVFRDTTGKKHAVLFQIQSAGFGGIDIFGIALKNERKNKPAVKNKTS
jgi:hypothetical protein